MKKSKKGTWTLDDPKYYCMVDVEKATILMIKMYRFGFNSITFMMQKDETTPDKFIEQTYPKYFGDAVTFSSIELAMQYLIRLYNNRNISEADVKSRIEKYKIHLINNFPELLI